MNATRVCVIPGCTNPWHGRGVCRKHYMMAWRGQMPWPAWERSEVSLDERFWQKVDIREPGQCWEWLASKLRNGYGQFNSTTAHRVAYQLSGGVLIDGMHIDHLCRNRSCVNPSHLEQVTVSENTRRGNSGVVSAARMRLYSATRTHCKNGHEMTAENTYFTPKEGWRQCRECRRDKDKRRKERIKNARLSK